MRRFIFTLFITASLFLNAVQSDADDTELFTVSVSPDVLIVLDLSGSMNEDPTGQSCNTPGCTKLEIAKGAIEAILDDNKDGKINSTDEKNLGVRMGYMRFYQCSQEDSPNYNEGCNKLIKALGSPYSSIWNSVSGEQAEGWTPLSSACEESKKYLDDHKVTDNAKECRKKFVVLITDGWDTRACNAHRESCIDYNEYKRRRKSVAMAKAVADAGYQLFVIGFGANMPHYLKNTLNWMARWGRTDNPADNFGDRDAYNPDGIGDNCADEPSSKIKSHYLGDDPNRYLDCKDPWDPGATLGHYYAEDNDPGEKDLDGYAFIATNAEQLNRDLKTVFKYIVEKAFSFTAPTVPSVRLVENDVVYMASFTPDETPFWKGDLKAYRLEQDGTLAVNPDGSPKNPPLWEALEKLEGMKPSDRTVYTVKGGTRVSFDSTNISPADLGLEPADRDGRDALINHVKGIDAYDIDGDSDKSDKRPKMLGDIFHSAAAIVGEPSRFFIDETEYEYAGAVQAYAQFYKDNKDRPKVIMVGANDGMLHAFGAGDGFEKWAIIPGSLLPSLKSMKSSWDQYVSTGTSPPHLYYVDSSPKVADVWFYSSTDDRTKSASEWRTVLVCGLRKGGKKYLALDITNTLSPQFLWEFPTDAATLAKMGGSWSEPAIGRVKVIVGSAAEERWVALFGGGLDPVDPTKGRAFFVVDIKTGAKIWEFSYDGGDARKQYMTHPLAAAPTAVDVNGDGYIDRVYIGDLGGQLWMFDLSQKDAALWTGQRLFTAPTSPSEKHPIYYQPAVAFDKNGTPWVYFGTGDRELPKESTAESFYAVRDDGSSPYPSYPYSESDLKNVTTENTFTPPTTEKGWYIKLDIKEKVLSRATVFNQLLYFTTYLPKEGTDECKVGGTATLYVVYYLSGGGALSVDDLKDLQGIPTARSKVIGTGVPSAPVITMDTKGHASIIIGTTEGQVTSQPALSPTTNVEMLYWREVAPF
jgi:hypothetical protein